MSFIIASIFTIQITFQNTQLSYVCTSVNILSNDRPKDINYVCRNVFQHLISNLKFSIFSIFKQLLYSYQGLALTFTRPGKINHRFIIF